MVQKSDFYYDLPNELIAQYPLAERRASRLLVLDRVAGSVHDHMFVDLLSFLRPNDLLVFNNTKVMKARLSGKKTSGGKVSLLVERVLSDNIALVHLKSNGKISCPCELILRGGHRAVLTKRLEHGLFELCCENDVVFLMEEQGEMPLPPYIKASLSKENESRYQTCYAQHLGAVAAPTAGLHFDTQIMADIKSMGISCAEITLHVGAGTFQPVRVENLEAHVMHQEALEVNQDVVNKVQACKAAGGRVIAIGTTVVRALESAASNGVLAPYCGETQLFITPGYSFQCVDVIFTNFHLPYSTLLMLVSAFSGHANCMKAYQHAVQQRYRFFSWGDAMIIV